MNERPTSFKLSDCADCPIRHRAVCAHCEADELAELEAIKSYRSYSAGDPIIWAGEPLDFVASVVTGVASLTQTMEDGRRQMVGLLMPSDFIGRPNRETLRYDVTAVTDISLCCFRRKPFQKIVEQTPHVSQRLLEMTLDELDAAREWMLLLGRKTAREKIASFLAILARRKAVGEASPRQGALSIEIPLTREAMSEYLGLTLETVSRQMSGLKRDGLIVLEGKRKVLIPEFGALLSQTGDEGFSG